MGVFQTFWGKDPNTAAAWTIAGVNATTGGPGVAS